MARVEGVLGQALRCAVRLVLECGVGVEGNGDAGELLDVLEEGWVQLGAEQGEREQRGRIVGVVNGEHAGSGVCGGVRESGVALQEEDAGSASMEFQGKREADYASTGDEHIRRGSWQSRGWMECAGGHESILVWNSFGQRNLAGTHLSNILWQRCISTFWVSMYAYWAVHKK